MQTVGAVSGTVGYTYTRFGAVESVTDGLGTRSFAFADGSLALLSETLPAYYNHAGAGGGTPRVLGYEYSTTGTGADVAGRLARTGLGTATDPFAEQSDAYAYTTDGRLASLNARGVADGTGGHAWSRQFDYGYHELSPGLVTSVAEAASGYAIEREYDDCWGAVGMIKTSLGAATVARFDYEYDGRGLRSTMRQGGQAFADYGGTGGETFWAYEYNARGELTGAQQFMGGDVQNRHRPLPGRHYQFGYDAQGNRKKAGNTGDSGLDEAYTANTLNQIVTKENNNVHISGLGVEGMRVATTAPGASLPGTEGRFWSVEVPTANTEGPAKAGVPVYFGKRNARAGGGDLLKREDKTVFQPAAQESFDYDADGNLIQDGVWHYTYDEQNRLLSMETRTDNGAYAVLLQGADNPHPRKVVFTYDYMGRRASKTSYAVDPAGNPLAPLWLVERQTRFIWRGWTLEAEVDGATGQAARYLHWDTGMAGGLRVIRDEEESACYLPTCDGNGNVTALIEVATGAIAAAYEYSPFGELLRKEGSYADKNPFRWSTQYTDDETGLVYYGYRYYSPRLGRFLNQDPIKEFGGINLYAFTGNNPVTFIDLLGLNDYFGDVWQPPPSDGDYDIYAKSTVVYNDDGTITSYNPNGSIMISWPNGDGTYRATFVQAEWDPPPHGSNSLADTGYMSDEIAFVDPFSPTDFYMVTDDNPLSPYGTGMGGPDDYPAITGGGGSPNTLTTVDLTNSAVGATAGTAIGRKLSETKTVAQSQPKAPYRGVSKAQLRKIAKTRGTVSRLATAGKITSGAGAVVGIGIAIADITLGGASNRSLARGFIGGASTFTAFIPVVGPFVALGLSVTNAAGGFNWFYEFFDDRRRF